MRILYGVVLIMLAVTGANAQEKIGVIYKDTAYIGWEAENYNLVKANLHKYGLAETDLIEIAGNQPRTTAYKWINAYKVLLPDTCSECVPVYHIVDKSEGLFRIGKWYGNQSAANLKRLNGLRSERLAYGQKLLVGYCKIAIQHLLLVTSNSQPGVTAAGDTATTKPLPPQTATKDTIGQLPKPSATARPAEPDPVLSYSGIGFFEPEWKNGGVENHRSGKAAIFKSVSGWHDGKFYLLASFLTPGTLVKLVNPANGKYVVAKVLAPLPEIKIIEGLICRLNDAAAA
ncbi:MAG: hypothetical protein MUF24_14660, partial [Chitinophagaceae bacterium]|nr:hypothetical protein [Chitinophagaceae bacterium]